jgi:hypothetical protein
MQDMTDEEADALDEYFTKNLPKTDPAKGGVTTRQVSAVINEEGIGKSE